MIEFVGFEELEAPSTRPKRDGIAYAFEGEMIGNGVPETVVDEKEDEDEDPPRTSIRPSESLDSLDSFYTGYESDSYGYGVDVLDDNDQEWSVSRRTPPGTSRRGGRGRRRRAGGGRRGSSLRGRGRNLDLEGSGKRKIP